MDLLESSFSYDCQDFDPLVPTASDLQLGDLDSGHSDLDSHDYSFFSTSPENAPIFVATTPIKASEAETAFLVDFVQTPKAPRTLSFPSSNSSAITAPSYAASIVRIPSPLKQILFETEDTADVELEVEEEFGEGMEEVEEQGLELEEEINVDMTPVKRVPKRWSVVGRAQKINEARQAARSGSPSPVKDLKEEAVDESADTSIAFASFGTADYSPLADENGSFLLDDLPDLTMERISLAVLQEEDENDESLDMSHLLRDLQIAPSRRASTVNANPTPLSSKNLASIHDESIDGDTSTFTSSLLNCSTASYRYQRDTPARPNSPGQQMFMLDITEDEEEGQMTPSKAGRTQEWSSGGSGNSRTEGSGDIKRLLRDWQEKEGATGEILACNTPTAVLNDTTWTLDLNQISPLRSDVPQPFAEPSSPSGRSTTPPLAPLSGAQLPLCHTSTSNFMTSALSRPIERSVRGTPRTLVRSFGNENQRPVNNRSESTGAEKLKERLEILKRSKAALVSVSSEPLSPVRKDSTLKAQNMTPRPRIHTSISTSSSLSSMSNNTPLAPRTREIPSKDKNDRPPNLLSESCLVSTTPKKIPRPSLALGTPRLQGITSTRVESERKDATREKLARANEARARRESARSPVKGSTAGAFTVGTGLGGIRKPGMGGTSSGLAGIRSFGSCSSLATTGIRKPTLADIQGNSASTSLLAGRSRFQPSMTRPLSSTSTTTTGMRVPRPLSLPTSISSTRLGNTIPASRPVSSVALPTTSTSPRKRPSFIPAPASTTGLKRVSLVPSTSGTGIVAPRSRIGTGAAGIGAPVRRV